MKTFLLVAVLVGLPMQVQAEFWAGNKLVADMREWEKNTAGQTLATDEWYGLGEYVGYVVAAFDAFQMTGVICASKGITVDQAPAIVSAHLNANPTDWHFTAISLVRDALEEAFPCG